LHTVNDNTWRGFGQEFSQEGSGFRKWGVLP
jgi:hypothetical protein